MKFFIAIFAIVVHFVGHTQEDEPPRLEESLEIPILWKSLSLSDYDFRHDWSYPLGVYVNQWGQVSCDGFCPPEVDGMKDDQGKIFDDSLAAFYQIIDTTHLPHTINCGTVNMYEFAGTDFIHFTMKDEGILGSTENSPATHSSLNILIEGDVCSAWVRFLSIRSDASEMNFFMNYGRIILDPIAYEQGIIKGYFDFRFKNDSEPTVPLQWNGFLDAPIESE